ncbi:unnamed protein product [Prorocentrum cordatum]|uniref:FCP1 homology domain-containing protein n=1 Tax=Prorocentrum cordatum TaxID=2364126 RepID=A0ABN9X3X3_9DINO|nr:unnamed protein product [Polarella glacialis]
MRRATASRLLRGRACAPDARQRLHRACLGHRRGLAQESGVQPLVLLLDLDETLLRPRIPQVHKYDLASVDLSITIPVNDGVHCDLSLRPGLARFFEWIRERRRAGRLEGPWLFAQGHSAYVTAVLAELDPEKDIFSDRVLSKDDACTPTKTPWVLKDLTKVACSGGGGASSLEDGPGGQQHDVLHPAPRKHPDGARLARGRRRRRGAGARVPGARWPDGTGARGRRVWPAGGLRRAPRADHAEVP